MNHRRFVFLPILAALAGCAVESGAAKGAEDGSFDDYEGGKADSFYRPTEHGTLVFGIPQRAALTDEGLFHAWDFVLDGEGSVLLETAPESLDTVMYLYRRDPGTERWGRYVARNDDSEGSLGSRIAEELDAGEYRVLVKGYKSQIRGELTLLGQCAGAGCATPAASCDPDDVGVLELCIEEACQHALGSAGGMEDCLYESCHDDFDAVGVSASCVTCATLHAVESAAPGTDGLAEACGTDSAPTCDADSLDVLQLCIQEACQTAIENGWDLGSCIQESCHDDLEAHGVTDACLSCAVEHGPDGADAFTASCG